MDKSLTTDEKDVRLDQVDDRGFPLVTLVLSDEERRSRPHKRRLRNQYVHVGSLTQICGEITGKSLITKKTLRCTKSHDHEESCGNAKSDKNIVKFDNRYFLKKQGCDTVTTIMKKEVYETLAIEPQFYEKLFCSGCKKQVPLNELVWLHTDVNVGT